MAGSNESKKETVEIEISVPPSEKSPEPKVKPRKRPRIQSPAHQPMEKTPLPILIPTAIPAPVAQAPASPSLKKETVSVSDLADLPAPEIKDSEPLSDMPGAAAHDSSFAAVPAEKNSMLLMWLLLGVSALILIIQIWTYFS